MANQSDIQLSNGKTKAMVCFFAGLAMTGIATAAIMQLAPGAKAATTLKIQLDAPKLLSKQAGIRLARIVKDNGQTCFRASRRLAQSSRTITETFCTH